MDVVLSLPGNTVGHILLPVVLEKWHSVLAVVFGYVSKSSLNVVCGLQFKVLLAVKERNPEE